MSSESSRTETYLDDDDYGYAQYGVNSPGDRKRRPKPTPDDQENEDEAKEYRKKLLISLAMLLPAIAAIIGVMAWAISAEVVLGAKREASRRIGENGGGSGNYLKLPNRYDYTRFTSAPLLPPKEMLVDHRNYNKGSKTKKNNDANTGTASQIDILQKHLEELSKEYLHKRNDPDDEGSANLNELKNRLLQENLSQLLAKLFNNNNNNRKSNIDNGTKPTIVVVAPLASQSKTFSETKVTTTKPKALELKIASVSSGGNNNNRDGGHHKNHHQQQQQHHHQHDKNSIKANDQSKSLANKNSIKRKTNQNVVIGSSKKSATTNNGSQKQPATSSKTSMDSKRKTSNQIVVQKQISSSRNVMNSKNLPPKQNSNNFKNSKSINVGSKQMMTQGTAGKGSKGKTYEKEIDLLLQKIEKLEKQKLQPQTSLKLRSQKIMVKEFDKKRPSGIISEKIKKFMESAPKEERNEPNQANQDSLNGNQWDPMQSMMPPPMPMPPPPMPMMPFMPYMPPMPQPADPIVDQQPQPSQLMPNEMSPMAPIQEEYPDPQQQYYQQPQQQPPPQPTEYMSEDYLAQQQPQQQPMQMMSHPYQQQNVAQYQPQPQLQSQQQQPTLIEGFQPIYSQPQQQLQSQPQQVSTIQQGTSSTNLMNGQYQPQSNHIYNTLTNDQMNQITRQQNQQQQQQQSSKSSKKPNKSVSLFGRRFQIGKIFTLPKGRKTKKQQQQQQQQLQQEQEMAMQQSDNFDQMLLNPPTVPPPTDNAPFDPMMAQESQQYGSSSVERGYRPGGGGGGGGYPMETAGMSVRFGGGPLGGGSQVKVNPMAILKTIALPMMRRPALNLNGKVVFGVVLENGAGGHGRKPKTVFQHYSTGRIKRR